MDTATLDPTLVQEIVKALGERAWYPLIGLVITLLIAIWRYVKPQVWEKIPSKWKPVPALAVSALSAFAAAVSSGETWQVAVTIALYTLVVTWTSSTGVADIYVRIFGKQKSESA